MNLIKSDSMSSLASVIPILAYFCLIIISYRYGNTFGISLTYLGCMCYSQILQFFQGFKNIHYYYQALLMASKYPGDENAEDIGNTLSDVIDFCKFYGKFSTGVSLFVHKIMCFTILVDSFNMQVLDQINLIEPYSLLSILLGCLFIQVFISLDHICAARYVKFFMHTLTQIHIENIDDPSW
jgi:hypothetical protein